MKTHLSASVSLKYVDAGGRKIGACQYIDMEVRILPSTDSIKTREYGMDFKNDWAGYQRLRNTGRGKESSD